MKLFSPPNAQSTSSFSELGDSSTLRSPVSATASSDSRRVPLALVDHDSLSEGVERSHPASNGFLSDGLYLLPVSSASVQLTLNQLAVMIQNGVELAEAVGHVADHCEDPRLAASLDGIHEALSGGSHFSQAVACHGRYFPDSLPAMLAAAETTGDVPGTLANVCDRMREEMEVRGTISGAMIYPVILGIAAVVVMATLILAVLPQFDRVFESHGETRPGVD